MLQSAPPEFYTEERCHIREWVNSPDHPAASLAQCRVEPGVHTQRHRLTVDEWYVIRSGSGLLFLGDGAGRRIEPGDRVLIEAGTAQSVHNDQSVDLVFDCLCMPRFEPDCYESLEK